MSIDLIIILVIITGFGIIIFVLNKKLSGEKQDETLVQWLKSMQSSLDTRLDNATQLMGQIRQDAGRFAEL